MQKGHINQIDGLRALAVGLVFLAHTSQAFPNIRILHDGVGRYSVLGVQIFFVLSGFLITGILLKTKDSDTYLSSFFVRRGLRLYPLFYTFVLVVALSGFAKMHGGHLWPYLLYVANLVHANGPAPFGPLWSLCVEEQFYLVWPFAVLFLSRRHLEKMCFVVIAVSISLRFTDISWQNTLLNMDALSFGALIALHSDELCRFRKVAALSACLLPLGPTFAGSVIVEAFCRTIQVVSAAGLVVMVLNAPFFLNRLLKTAPMRYVGRISYGVYMLQSLVMAAFLKSGFEHRAIESGSLTRAALVIAMEAVATIGIASVSFYVLETPFLKLKNRVRMHTQLPKQLLASGG